MGLCSEGGTESEGWTQCRVRVAQIVLMTLRVLVTWRLN